MEELKSLAELREYETKNVGALRDLHDVHFNLTEGYELAKLIIEDGAFGRIGDAARYLMLARVRMESAHIEVYNDFSKKVLESKQAFLENFSGKKEEGEGISNVLAKRLSGQKLTALGFWNEMESMIKKAGERRMDITPLARTIAKILEVSKDEKAREISGNLNDAIELMDRMCRLYEEVNQEITDASMLCVTSALDRLLYRPWLLTKPEYGTAPAAISRMAELVKLDSEKETEKFLLLVQAKLDTVEDSRYSALLDAKMLKAKLKILVVHNNLDARTTFATKLQENGYTAKHVKTIGEAFELCKKPEEKLDIIFANFKPEEIDTVNEIQKIRPEMIVHPMFLLTELEKLKEAGKINELSAFASVFNPRDGAVKLLGITGEDEKKIILARREKIYETHNRKAKECLVSLIWKRNETEIKMLLLGNSLRKIT